MAELGNRAAGGYRAEAVRSRGMADRKTVILEAACRVIARRGVRGLRVDEIAREAGVSTALIYYYFAGRADLLMRALEFVNDRASAYTCPDLPPEASAREHIREALLREFQDVPTVIEDWLVWSELTASAIFDPELRAAVRTSRAGWEAFIAGLVRSGQQEGTVAATIAPDDVAQRLIALVEGLSATWLIGAMTLERTRSLVAGGVERELGPIQHPHQKNCTTAAGSSRAARVTRP